MNGISTVDVSARDGLQNEKNAVNLSAADKAAYIAMLAESGLTRIEAGSFVHPKAVPAMANSGEVAELLKPIEKKFPAIVFSYLVPNLKGLERAKAIQAKEVAIFLALSEKFSKANINQSVADAFRDIEPTIKASLASGMRVRGYISNLFGYDDYPFAPEDVALRSKQLLGMGCYEVSLGDTTGIGTPENVETVIAVLKSHSVPLDKIAMHFHDTFGAAITNVDRSYTLGIRTFDASTGGTGGCPYANSPKGNLALEDLLVWADARGIPHEVKDKAALEKAAAFIRGKLGK